MLSRWYDIIINPYSIIFLQCLRYDSIEKRFVMKVFLNFEFPYVLVIFPLISLCLSGLNNTFRVWVNLDEKVKKRLHFLKSPMSKTSDDIELIWLYLLLLVL